MYDLERSIAKRSAANPRYPAMLAAEIRRQRLIGALVAERKANHLTQAAVAEAMNVSQSVVAEIESARVWGPLSVTADTSSSGRVTVRASAHLRLSAAARRDLCGQSPLTRFPSGGWRQGKSQPTCSRSRSRSAIRWWMVFVHRIPARCRTHLRLTSRRRRVPSDRECPERRGRRPLRDGVDGLGAVLSDGRAPLDAARPEPVAPVPRS